MLGNRERTLASVAVVAAALIAGWLILRSLDRQERPFPYATLPSLNAGSAPIGVGQPESAESTQAVKALRSPVAWLTLRPVAAMAGLATGGVQLAAWGPRGVSEVGFDVLQQGGLIVVPAEQQLGDQRICVVSEGFAPCDVTDLILQGGQHSCLLEAAARFDIALEDMTKLEAVVAVVLERESILPGGGRRVVWPTAATDSACRFDLVPGTYRLAVEDDSTIIWSGGEPIVVGDLTPQRRTVVLAGLVASAIWSTTAEIQRFAVEAYPSDLTAVHDWQTADVAQRLRASLDPAVYLRFAATRSLMHRRLTHSVQVRLGSGDGTTRLHSVAFQPLDRITPEEVRLESSSAAGKLKVTLVGPSGVKLDGVDVWVADRRLDRTANPVAILESGGDWWSLAPGSYTLMPRLPASALGQGKTAEAIVSPGGLTEAAIPMSQDLVAAYLKIEVEGEDVLQGASVRIQGEGFDAVYSTTKPERIRVWVPPTKLGVEVLVSTVSEEFKTRVQIDFAAAGPHLIKIASK